MDYPARRRQQVEEMESLLIAFATGGTADEEKYKHLREILCNDPALNGNLPSFIHQCRTLSQFWSYIKQKFGTYEERRHFIWQEFQNAHETAERIWAGKSQD